MIDADHNLLHGPALVHLVIKAFGDRTFTVKEAHDRSCGYIVKATKDYSLLEWRECKHPLGVLPDSSEFSALAESKTLRKHVSDGDAWRRVRLREAAFQFCFVGPSSFLREDIFAMLPGKICFCSRFSVSSFESRGCSQQDSLWLVHWS